MTVIVELEEHINSVLAAWNPIGVPDCIATIEYRSFVKDIISIGCDVEDLFEYLKKLVVDVIVHIPTKLSI